MALRLRTIVTRKYERLVDQTLRPGLICMGVDCGQDQHCTVLLLRTNLVDWSRVLRIKNQYSLLWQFRSKIFTNILLFVKQSEFRCITILYVKQSEISCISVRLRLPLCITGKTAPINYAFRYFRYVFITNNNDNKWNNGLIRNDSWFYVRVIISYSK